MAGDTMLFRNVAGGARSITFLMPGSTKHTTKTAVPGAMISLTRAELEVVHGNRGALAILESSFVLEATYQQQKEEKLLDVGKLLGKTEPKPEGKTGAKTEPEKPEGGSSSEGDEAKKQAEALRSSSGQGSRRGG